MLTTERLFAVALAAGCIAATSGLPATASASVIQVDLNDAGAAPGAGWNVIPANTIGGPGVALSDSTGGPTDSTLSIDAGFQTSSTGGHAGAFSVNAVDDYFFVRSSTGAMMQVGTITLEGLEAGEYKVELYASISSDPTSRIGDYQVNGAFGDSPEDGLTYDAHADGYDNGSLMVWEAVQVGEDGLTITVDTRLANSTRVAPLNALRVTLVPEPASLALLGTGAVLLTTRSRRSR